MPGFREKVVSGLIRTYPLLSGCGTLANSAAVRRLAGDSTEQTWADGPGGPVLVPLDDYVGRAVYFAGDLDRKITRLCRLLVRPGDTVLDVGANYGLVTTLLARLVGDGGQVHAFEPNPRVFALLRRTVERHSDNITLHEFALGECEEMLTLVAPEANAGAGSFWRGRGNGQNAYPVQVRLLDDMVDELGFNSIRLIKLDVEGHEPEVLRGGARTLESLRPTCILVELNERDRGRAAHPSIELLAQCGYRLFNVPRCLLRLRLDPFDSSSGMPAGGHEILAVAPGDEGDDVIARIDTVPRRRVEVEVKP